MEKSMSKEQYSMTNYKIIEKFTSIDGEGPSAGELATFIRFLGCDLRCTWCDTKYSWDGSVKPEVMCADEIYDDVKMAGVTNVTLTGGEPLIQKGISDVITRLAQDSNLTIRIETHGGIDIAPFKEAHQDPNVQFIVDFKLPSSGMMDRMCHANFEAVDDQDTYKFVIASEEDLAKAIELVTYHGLQEKCLVYFSPVVERIAAKDIVDQMIKEKLNGVRLQLQLHKYIWPKDMRGV